MFGSALTKVFGSRNDRLVKRYRKIVAQVNAFEPKVVGLTDQQLLERTQELKDQLTHQKLRMSDTLPEALAIVREAMDRAIGIREIFNPENTFDPEVMKDEQAFQDYAAVEDRLIQGVADWKTVPITPALYKAVNEAYPDSRPPFRARCFDVQLIGGLVMYENKIAEMATGEGKTFVAPLACFLRALEGYRCHVVTVNDYLVRRDATWIQPAFAALGLSVGFVQSDMDPGGEARRRMYECDVTYGTNSEFGFDYLRDNMKSSAAEQVQGPLDFAIVDEVDSILIDEARTPLIISGSAQDDPKKFAAADIVARKIVELHKPYAAVEAEVDHWKRAIKAAQGDADKAGSKVDKDAAAGREKEAIEKLAEAESKKEGLTQYYEVEMDRKSVHLTHDGIAAAQDAAGVGSFYVGENVEWPHLMEQAMRAHVVYERDRDYVVEVGTGPRASGQLEVVIVDEYTGRKMQGRQWSDGLHQACEAKERVQIKEETQTLATITLQNFFKLYKFLGGMTGTAQTESEEFNKIYKLEVVTIPTNRDRIRKDSDDRVYRTEPEKWEQMIEEIKLYSDAGRPVLVGTTSVDKSERISQALSRKYGIKHEVLNAKHHEREANIVAVAGQTHENTFGERVGNVTIATNMAGRGTDIKLAPDAWFDVAYDGTANWKLTRRGATKTEQTIAPDSPLVGVYGLTPTTKVAGGLHVIGTERHTSRRIDNQLRGRSGRQGDPGSSRFYCSLQDDLLKMFMGEWTVNVFKKIGMEYGEAIERKMLSRGIMKSQRKFEERNFLARKNLLDYDEVSDFHRSTFYGIRQQVLEGRHIENVIWDMIGLSINDAVKKYVTEDYVAANLAEWARTNFEVIIDPEELHGLRRYEDVESYIRNQAKLELNTTISQTLGEYTGEDPDDVASWDVKSIERMAERVYHTKISAARIKKMSPRELEDTLQEGMTAFIDTKDVSGINPYLEPDFASRALAAWADDKFGVKVTPAELMLDAERHEFKSAAELVKLIDSRARDVYRRRESEYPVDHLLGQVGGGEVQQIDNPYAADFVRNWAHFKYGYEMTVEHIQQTPIPQLRDELIVQQRKFLEQGQLEKDVDAIMTAGPDLANIAEAFNTRFGQRVTAKDLDPMTAETRKGTKEIDEDASGSITPRDIALRRARGILRGELTQLEQYVLITIFDQAWKDHLYAMDVLKGSIGLQGFAEKDPKVAFKREGYKYFEQMLEGIRDKVTDLIFRVRVEGGQEPVAKSNYTVTAAQHQVSDAYGVADNIAETAAAVGDNPTPDQADESAAVTKTIVRETPKVGRNDPCPCGSGKKYKNCHGVDA
ncbi:MAG: preprotein translocase subunit SecA [Phycisphaerales bacterium]|nr:preprotein translocase subunit SecA [Phycisphaerales bacterium]